MTNPIVNVLIRVKEINVTTVNAIPVKRLVNKSILTSLKKKLDITKINSIIENKYLLTYKTNLKLEIIGDIFFSKFLLIVFPDNQSKIKNDRGSNPPKIIGFQIKPPPVN